MRLHRFESRQRLIIRLGIAMILVLGAGAWISSMAIERELTGRIDDNLHAEIDTMTEVLEHVWQFDFGGDGSVVETYISTLRRKVDRSDPRQIRTVRGFGYVIRDEAS